MKPLACCFSLLFVAIAAVAQVRESVTVELIEVPVYVFGPDGQPMRGLTKDNFELRVNGRAQPIDYFDAVDYGTIAADGKTAAAAPQHSQRERRLYLLLFDRVYSVPGRLARAQRAAGFAVDQSKPLTDLFAVATYSAKDGVQFATPFLSDRAGIRRAIATLSVSRARDPFGIAISSVERQEWDKDGSVASIGNSKYGEDSSSAINEGIANQEMLLQPDRDRVTDLLENFGDLAQRLSQLEGQKHVLLFSEGFRSSLVHGGAHPVPTNMQSGGGVDAASMRALDDLYKNFRSAGVFLDTVDIAGVHHLPGSSFDNDSLQFLARGTGGEFVRNQNDLGNAVTGLTKAQQVVYVLAFNRRDARGGSIEVRVNGLPRGSRVSFRQGFGSAERGKDVDPLKLADILVNDIPQSGFQLPIRASASELEVALLREQIVPQLVDGSPKVDVVLYIFDSSGNSVGAMQKTIMFDAAERKKSGAVILRKSVNLPSGHYVAKAIARIAGTASIGFARTEITVP